MSKRLPKTVRTTSIKTTKDSANISLKLEQAYRLPRVVLNLIESAKKDFGHDDFEVWLTVYSNRGYIQVWARSNVDGKEVDGK